jgi:hypothetical protein
VEINLNEIITGLPVAVVLALYFLIKYWSDIASAIKRLYTDTTTDYVDKREASQVLRESQLDFELQTRASRESQDFYERTAAIDILKDQLKYSREAISSIEQGQIDTNRELIRIRGLLQGHQMILSKIDERLDRLENDL